LTGLDDRAPQRAGLDDRAALMALQKASYAPLKARLGGLSLQPSDADFTVILADYEVWVLRGAEELEAAAILAPKSDHLLIWSLAVAPAGKGRGLGNALLAFAERRAATLGLGEVRLFTNALFVENIAWYQRKGYGIERVEQRADRQVVHFRRTLPQP
jgi:ribosomal protein S18 acetylase RimI-like enzyme